MSSWLCIKVGLAFCRNERERQKP